MRRLMAIVMIDIVGYSRLMADDEDGTLGAWQELRTIIDPLFERGGCRIVKSTGDGLLIEASSVVDAVRASIEVQKAVEAWNLPRPPAAHLRLRIGVNLGDVVLDDSGDIYGDGVNVAARLESLAAPGGISMSDAAYQQVRGRIDTPIVDTGEQSLKNIPTPIRVWAIHPDDWVAAPTTGRSSGRRRGLAIAGGGIAIVAVVTAGVVVLRPGSPEVAAPTTTIDAASTTATSKPADSHAWTIELDAEGSLIAASTDSIVVASPDRTIEAFAAADGTRRWPAPVDVGGTVVSLAVDAGLAFVAVRDSRVIRAVDLETGDEAWRSLLDLPASDLPPRLASVDGYLYVSLGFGVAKLDESDGVAKWTVPLVGDIALDQLAAGPTLVSAGDGHSVHGIDPATGGTTWSVGPPQVTGGATWIEVLTSEVESGFSSTVATRVLIVSGDRDLIALDGRSGAVVWTVPVDGTPIVFGDTVFVAGVDRQLTALAADDGAEMWTRDDVHVDWPPMTHGESLVVFAESGLLAINPRSGTTTGSLALEVAPSAAPRVVGDVIVVTTGSTLRAFPIPR